MPNVFVHRLVGYYKFGEKIFDKNFEIRHLNSNSKDNSFDNIGIGSHSENMLDVDKATRVERAKHATAHIIINS